MTKIVTLNGTAMYAKIFEDNRDMKGYEDAYVECNGAYEIVLLLNDVEYQKLQESGSKIEGTLNEDGLHQTKFKRKHEVYDKNGNVIEDFSGPPRVVDADGELWAHTPELPNYVGNGSEVDVAVSVRQDKKKKSIVYTRLEAVRVLNLVPLDGETQLKLPF